MFAPTRVVLKNQDSVVQDDLRIIEKEEGRDSRRAFRIRFRLLYPIYVQVSELEPTFFAGGYSGFAGIYVTVSTNHMKPPVRTRSTPEREREGGQHTHTSNSSSTPSSTRGVRSSDRGHGATSHNYQNGCASRRGQANGYQPGRHGSTELDDTDLFFLILDCTCRMSL